MNTLTTLTNLSGSELMILALICFAAGLVRGFSGFALSAMVMACAATLIPPVELIPICWWLEMTASLLMVRGGWADADRAIVYALFIGSAIGTPFGMYLTTSVSPETSKMIALLLVAGLAALQLARFRLPALASKPGLYGSGLAAGVVTGLASIGGMIVALYVLAQEKPAAVMRGSLVIFLFLGSITSMITYLAFGVMDSQATNRGLLLAIPVAAGVILGKLTFTPRLEPYYKPFCLSVLVGLASIGLIRTVTN